MEEVIEGLLILREYMIESRWDMAAEHDQIWAGPDTASEMEINEIDLDKLEELGWFIDEEFDSWTKFV